MVCKKSLYCIKNGPCANYQLRKQIWEDNIRFRENLRNLNQSDHYWSFQINNEHSNVDDELSLHRRNKVSLKCKNVDDCASITHEFSKKDESYSNCSCKPKEELEKNLKTENDIPVEKKSDVEGETTCLGLPIQMQHSFQNVHKRQLINDSDHFGICKNMPVKHLNKYSNSLTSASFQANSKIKFASQHNLVCPRKNTSARKFPSMEVIPKVKSSFVTAQNSSRQSRLDVKESIQLIPGVQEKNKDKKNKNQLNNVKLKNVTQHKDIKLTPWLCGTPLSRTTRRMFHQERKTPFATFICNNINECIDKKKTHNVFASVKEVLPNVLNIKQHKEDLIVRSLKNEKSHQKN